QPRGSRPVSLPSAVEPAAVVASLLERLEQLPRIELARHPAVFEEIHRALQGLLADLDVS
ncbi:MAG: hypothetical protein ACYCU5_13265, partial [Actinomycetes bacterium]